MKLLEADQKYHMDETKNVFYVSNTTKRKTECPLILISADGQPLVSSKKIAAIRIATRGFNNLMAHYYDGRYNTTGANPFAGMDSLTKVELNNNLLRYLGSPYTLRFDNGNQKLLPFLKANSAMFKGIVSVEYFNDIVSASKWMLTKFPHMGTHVIYSAFGLTIENMADASDAVGDSHIVFPPSIRETRKADIKKLVETAFDILTKRNLGFLTKGRVIVKPLAGKVVGLYTVLSRTISIDPSAKASKEALQTILHEYGHKLWYEKMPDEPRRIIKQKYKSLIQSGEKIEVSMEDRRADAIKYILANIKIGDTVEFTGRGDNRKYSPYTVQSIKTGYDPKIVLASNAYPKVTLSGSPLILHNEKFIVGGKNLIADKENNGKKLVQDGWFPTGYSMTSEEEWWAECFSYYLLGQLTMPDLKQFVTSILDMS